MPLYEYMCESCGEHFELVVSLSQKDEDALCPKCNKKATRQFSPFAVGKEAAKPMAPSCATCPSSRSGGCKF